VAQRAERLIRSLGLADSASFGLELEFYLFDDVRFEQSSSHGYYFIDSEAAQHVGGAPARTHRPRRPRPAIPRTICAARSPR
jgi:glutamine synthetase